MQNFWKFPLIVTQKSNCKQNHMKGIRL